MSAVEPPSESSQAEERELTADIRRVLESTSTNDAHPSEEVFVGTGKAAAGMGVVVRGAASGGPAQAVELSRFIRHISSLSTDGAVQPVGVLVFAAAIDDAALTTALGSMHDHETGSPALVVPLTAAQTTSLARSPSTLWQFLDESVALVAIASERQESDRSNAASELLALLDELVVRTARDTSAAEPGSDVAPARLVHRVLSPKPITSLDMYLKARGGAGLEIARLVEPEALVDELEAAGLRGRGGAGFPTHIKWRTVAENASELEGTTVVVNGAEGEPGTYKDRTILLNNPYQVIEGALIAAIAVGADQIIFGLKSSFTQQLARLRAAIAEVETAGWTRGVELSVFEGPNEYLYGEETALLETIDGRYPFPRLAPPFRRGVREVVESQADVDTRSGLSAHVELAGASSDTGAPPTLVDNVETLANVPRIIARGGAWFRTDGTDASPGTIVCTITGSTQHAGVGEVIMGTTFREAITLIGGGAGQGRTIKAVMPGVSNALIPEVLLDTPLTYEDMAAAGSGLGSAGFVVFDDRDDLAAVMAGVSRFLAVESCGQCTPCKQDGLRIAQLLGQLCANQADDRGLATVEQRLATIDTGARCYLATQHQVAVRSLFQHFGDEVTVHLTRATAATGPGLTAELTSIDDGVATWDDRHRDKQPDWTYDAIDSGQFPAERLGEHRAPQSLPE